MAAKAIKAGETWFLLLRSFQLSRDNGEPVVVRGTMIRGSIVVLRPSGTTSWVGAAALYPLADADAVVPAVKPNAGERWRFVMPDSPAESVEILDAGGGYMGFVSATQGIVIVDLAGRPSCGALERSTPAAPARAKQHDEISLDEWRRKIRQMRWP